MRRILTPTRARGWPCSDADWSLNPYRGCALGCVYCHARFTHSFLDRGDPRDFERRILYKTEAPSQLARELQALARSRRGPISIAIGTITDPYQPAEERLGLTRGLLESLLASEGVALDLRLSTKSDLILRDRDLLKALSARGPLRVNVTVTTLDHDLARALEPRAPSPRRRLAALRELRQAGIASGVLLMPLVPGVNDGQEAIDRLCAEARAAGALYLTEAPLLLGPVAAEPFFRFLRRHSPQLEKAYHQAFDCAARAPERYRRKVRLRASRARRACGLPRELPGSGPRRPARGPAGCARAPRQLEIPGLG